MPVFTVHIKLFQLKIVTLYNKEALNTAYRAIKRPRHLREDKFFDKNRYCDTFLV